MGLILYALGVTLVAVFGLLAVMAAAFIYTGAWVLVALAYLAAKLVGAAWRPRRPTYRRRTRATSQAAYSDRR
jgi:hypothetical protein